MLHDRMDLETLPEPVAGMVAEYRARLARDGYDWGNEIEGGITLLLRFADRCDEGRWMAAFAEWKATGTLENPVDVLLRCLADPLPPGFAIARPGGMEMSDPLPYALPGRPFSYHVIVPADGSAPATLIETTVSGDRPDLEVGGHRTPAVEAAEPGRLRLVGDAVSRWTVVDDRDGAWFPDGAIPKWDAKSRPFFHGNDLLVEVPAGRLTVTVARGCEFEPVTVTVAVPPGDDTMVELSPRRLYDAAARGWYGADLHVHMNYTGDLVWTPHDVAVLQQGEGLHVLNLVAGNYSTALVYDREALEHFAGQDLPGSGPETVARVGVEYRNDIFGHFHALNPGAPPARYNTGHRRSDEPYDWPPNAVAVAELRKEGATIGYTHPLAVPMGEDGSPAEVFSASRARSYEARELVADAALGLVDSLDLMVGDIDGAEYLYHRLLGCGLRLAATAGTDVMLSRSRGRLTSNPPGWCRAYAGLGGRPLSVPAWQDAVRAGRTFATNGPWLEIDVAGRGPGEVVSNTGPTTGVPVVARVTGLGVERLEIVGPEGRVAALTLPAGAEDAELTAAIDVDRPTWLAAVARGGHHPMATGKRFRVYAHTSPVWVDVAGRSVARAADAAWCLDWLDRFEALARAEGAFGGPEQLDALMEVLNQARSFYRDITARPS